MNTTFLKPSGQDDKGTPFLPIQPKSPPLSKWFISLRMSAYAQVHSPSGQTTLSVKYS